MTDLDRVLHGANKIRTRLGGEPGMAYLFPDRPKGMHWKTYDGLSERVDAAERMADIALAQVVARMLMR